MKITIFGSCRQQALQKYYSTTSIQESLTYPHYTKEIIQAIEYCKGISKISQDDTKYCFRTAILNKSVINNQPQLQQEFIDTDVFVVEIASRISYEYKSNYVHHILAEEQYGIKNKQDILQRDLTDEEIEEDLCKIKELLYPKKVLIVSHIYTRESGKRYDLIKLLENLCLKHDLPFLSPSEYLCQETDVYLEEKILAHFTEKGYGIMSMIYKNSIEDLFKTNTVVLVIKQSYYNCIQNQTDNFWGMGDMMRSIYGAYIKSKEYNFKLIIDFSHHPISDFIICSNHKYSNEISNNINSIYMYSNKQFNRYLSRNLNSNKTAFVGAHFGPEVYNENICDNDIKFFIKKNIRMNSHFLSCFQEKIKNISLLNFNVIHYRLGDIELIQNIADTNKLTKYYNHLMGEITNNTILLTDSTTFKNYVKQNNDSIFLFNHDIGHIGYHSSYEKMKNSLIEYFILSKATSIKSYSVYKWTSGFTYSIHKIYDVPLTCISNLDDHLF